MFPLSKLYARSLNPIGINLEVLSLQTSSRIPTVPSSYTFQNLCFLCQLSKLSGPYWSWTSFLPSGHLTHGGFEPAMMQTIDSGSGSSVSMAEANGWTSSGHMWHHSHSIVAQLEQKLRSLEHFSSWLVPRSLMATYFLL